MQKVKKFNESKFKRGKEDTMRHNDLANAEKLANDIRPDVAAQENPFRKNAREQVIEESENRVESNQKNTEKRRLTDKSNIKGHK